MRRIIAIILILLFGAQVAGLSLTQHMCGKKLQYMTFGGRKKQSACCCKGKSDDKGCCKTCVIKVKLDDGKSFAKQVILSPQPLTADVLPQSIAIAPPDRLPLATEPPAPRIHPPPRGAIVRLHVLYCAFLI